MQDTSLQFYSQEGNKAPNVYKTEFLQSEVAGLEFPWM